MSAALNGNEGYLTDSLFKSICAAFPGTFNLDYLLTGEGSLLVDEGGAKVQDTDSGELEAHAWSKNTVTARYISDDRRKVDQAFALVLEKVRG